MTHGGLLGFVPTWLTLAFVVCFIALPTLVLAVGLYQRFRPLGVVSAVVFAGIWARTYFLWLEHGRLQMQAARETDCMGYGSMMPERCVEAINGAHVTPDGFFVWSATALGLSFLGLAIVFYETTDWAGYRRKLAEWRGVLLR